MQTHLINNQWHTGTDEYFESLCPFNNEVVWRGHAAGQEQIDLAIESAEKAYKSWRKTPIEYREALLQRFAALLQKNKQLLAETISKETGKPMWETTGEVGAMANKIAISIKAYHERTGTIENNQGASKAYIRHKPHGVVAVFGPYNFPGHLPNGHIVPALLAGNAVVFKPSEMTPLVAELTMKFWLESGLPEGLINLVQGQSQVGKYLAQHPKLDGLFFTGSSTTGKLLHKQFAGHPGKILALEMGGNNPLIIGETDNIEATVYHTIQSAFITSGQRCTCARRLFVPNTQFGQAFLDRLVEATKSIAVGDPMGAEQPFIGSMISTNAACQILAAQQALTESGAELLLEATMPQPKLAYITPGIVDVSMLKQVEDEEHFGPLIKVYRYNDFDDAISEANNTRFGLSAGLISESQAQYEQFYMDIRAGIVNWNQATTGASSAAPFGGIGDSGNHRASAFYAADYCAYPVSSVESNSIDLPNSFSPGLYVK